MSGVEEIVATIKAGARPQDLESATLDFKQEGPSLKKTFELVSDAVVCFANADGGTIIVGVADKVAGDASILGVSAELDERTLLRGVYDRTRPALSVPVRAHDVDGRKVLEVTVPAGATFYSNAGGTATRRVETDCMPFSPDQQRQALASRGLYDWSAEPSGTAEYSDEEMARVRRLLRLAGRSELAERDDATLLRDLRLAASTGELTKAGLLIVGNEADIARLMPSYGYSYQYRPAPGAEATDRFRGARSILVAVEQLIESIEARRAVRPLNLSGGVQLQLQDYPQEAVRELVVNAFVHRDFEVMGSTDVEQSPEQLRITSPGGLVFGVTVDNILSHPSTPRNLLLLETVTALRVAERAGQGVDRAFRYLLRSGKKPPTFEDTGSRVEARVSGGIGDDAFARYVNGHLPEAIAGDLEVLLVLDALCGRRSIHAQGAAPLLQRSPAEAQRALERMATESIVEPTKRTARQAHPNYGLTTAALTGLGRAVAYHRRNADGADGKVVEHIREYGFVTNQTLRRLFDLELYAARDMLADLQRRGVIEKLEGPSRGPGVRYGKGVDFPS